MEDNVFDKIHEVDLKDTMEESYINYAMSVIASRALPDVRDGLKPVQRRILYSMSELNNTPDKPHRKCARIVGDTMGKYHPHGDSSIYGALVNMAQDWATRYPMVDGHGNFGSVDGDGAAAMRYTEARLSKISMEMLADINKDTVDFAPNFDETEKEPVVMPARYPNLLVNGTSGIAVGMATNIPPHNLREVVSAIVKIIDNIIEEDRTTDLEEILGIVKGPDFPTGAEILGTRGIDEAYRTGRGKIRVRAVSNIETLPNGKSEIIVTEIPYMVNKARLIENIADLVKEKRIEGISDLNDESNRHGMRIVIELKKDANPQVVLNQLYRYTQLQDTVGVHLLALDGGVPKTMTLKTMLERYVAFQAQVVRRRTAFDLKKAEERAHILEGLKRATDIVDEIIATIRACKGGQAEARAAIMEQFGFDEVQAAAICAFRLGQLAGLEILKIESELAELQGHITEWRAILASDEKVYAIVKEELTALKEKYGDDRRTEIAHVSGEVDIEDLIPVEQCVFTLTHEGYIKRQPQDTYQVQKRGGRGISGLSHKDEDFVEELFIGSTHDFVLFVTDQGRVYRLKGYQIYEGSRTSRGTNIVNLLPLQNGEKVTSMLRMPAENAEGYLVMVTRQGVIKRTPIEAYANIRKSGLLAVSMYEGDSLAWTQLTTGEDELIVATHDGLAIRFNEQDARSMGRLGHGVRAIRLAEGDYVVGVGVVHPGATVFTVTENGKGRRSRIDDYRLQSRGGKGIRNYGKGEVAGIKVLEEEDDIILISQEGIIIRMHAADINIQSRYGSGVRVMRLGEGDRVVTVARTEHSDDAEVEKPENEPEEALSEEELAALAAEEAAQAEEPAEADDEEE